MKRRIISAILIIILIFPFCVSFSELRQVEELDVAFKFLEKDNVFLRRYNKITNQSIEPYFELGTPYFFGGQNEKHLLALQPKYVKRNAWQNSTYYKKGKLYLEGFDCMGFIKCINEHTKKEKPKSISQLINFWYDNKDNYIITHRDKEIPPFNELYKHLKIGDMLATRKDGKGHVMMYIGTLADYGFTEKEVPELKDYLLNPLVIHSTSNPQYSMRFEKFISENKEYKNCITSDGAICISILGVPIEKASHHIRRFNVDYHYFWIDNYSYMLTCHDWNNVKYFAWFRMPTETKKR